MPSAIKYLKIFKTFILYLKIFKWITDDWKTHINSLVLKDNNQLLSLIEF